VKQKEFRVQEQHTEYQGKNNNENCALGKRRAWKAIGDRLLKPCYLSREDHNRKFRTRKQRTDVGKYSFVNRTIKSWNQLPAGLLASIPCKLNTFRKRFKNVVTSKGVQVGTECK